MKNALNHKENAGSIYNFVNHSSKPQQSEYWAPTYFTLELDKFQNDSWQSMKDNRYKFGMYIVSYGTQTKRLNQRTLISHLTLTIHIIEIIIHCKMCLQNRRILSTNYDSYTCTWQHGKKLEIVYNTQLLLY